MVYLANDLRLERRVAVKVMHAHLAEDENFTRRFEREARSAARLTHPNLVNVYDQGEDAGHSYLVMEYLPGITLRELLKQQQQLTAEQALEIGEAVLAGLAAAHDADIVHRDLKPENVLLADDGRIKIGDFGLARAVSANTTTGQALLGTIAYLSPELVTRGIADARSDVYAFGIMLFEMLTGTQPFRGEQPMQIAYQHAHSEVPAPSTLTTDGAPELDELVLWTTERDAEVRPANASVVLERLQQLRRGEAPHATRVLPLTDFDGAPTPATAVLDGAQQAALAGDPAARVDDAADSAESHDSDLPETPLDRAAAAGRRRGRSGRVTAFVVVLVTVLAAGAGWWFGQGPGSRVTVPEVSGLGMSEAEDTLTSLTLVPEMFECSSLEVPVGDAVHSEPAAGTRVERDSTVRVCQSTGPEALPVPALIGLDTADAEAAIFDAGFTFGEIVDERFGEEDADTVIAALDEEGEALAEEYPEKARIDLVISAGTLPDVSGVDVDEATATLADYRLEVDSSLGAESYHDEISEGDVISVVYNTDPVRPEDTVGLEVSLGPELFEVPNVDGLDLEDAMEELSEAGFSPTTLVPERLRDFAEATGTEPAAGERVPAGTEIRVTSTLSL